MDAVRKRAKELRPVVESINTQTITTMSIEDVSTMTSVSDELVTVATLSRNPSRLDDDGMRGVPVFIWTCLFKTVRSSAEMGVHT